jgi:hypothetical protein
MNPREQDLRSRFVRIGRWGVMALVLAVTFQGNSARAGLVFNVTYDASVAGAPAGFTTAFDNAIQFIQSTYNDPITINLHVGWGEINGGSLSPGDLGQSLTNQQGFFSYAQVKTALTIDAKSAADATAVASLPTTDPYGGTKFVMSNAQAKAIGLLAGNAAGVDGFVGFNSTASYTFDPNNRGVAGKYDFIGLAEHEITEVMGRYGLGQNGASSGRYSPIDLFRYLSPGTLDLAPANGAYFSIDGGTTSINTYNGTGGGDLSDWKGNTVDSFNASLTQGVINPFSAGDMTLMDVIGYDPAVVPEPASLTLLASGVVVGLCIRRYRRKASDA